MSDVSPILSLPYIQPSQAQKHVTHNEALRVLDALVQLVVLDHTLTTAPTAASEGDAYLVAPGAGGAWAGQGDHIAVWVDAGWQYHPPKEGWRAWSVGPGFGLIHLAGVWVAEQTRDIAAETVGINSGADETNRLSVSSPATLLSHEGAGHQLKINKAASGDTASLLYQTAWSGRAEMGLAGDDDFRVKVSPDGSIWHGALTIGKDTGHVTLLGVSGHLPVHDTGNSVFLGEGAGASDDLTDNRNVFAGRNAGAATSSGDNNAALGYQALAANTVGVGNTALGAGTLADVTTGANNTAIGTSAGGGITTGSGNTILGANLTGLAAGLQNTVILADGAGNQRLSFDSAGVMDYKQAPVAATATPAFSHYIALKLNGTTFYLPAHSAPF
jgi:hypothetical protein